MYARKVDSAQSEIVGQLRELGFYVRDLSGVGKGFPDLCIAKNGFMALVELKTARSRAQLARKTASERLRAAQIEFQSEWKGPPIIVAYDLNTVLFDWNLLTKRYRSL